MASSPGSIPAPPQPDDTATFYAILRIYQHDKRHNNLKNAFDKVVASYEAKITTLKQDIHDLQQNQIDSQPPTSQPVGVTSEHDKTQGSKQQCIPPNTHALSTVSSQPQDVQDRKRKHQEDFDYHDPEPEPPAKRPRRDAARPLTAAQKPKISTHPLHGPSRTQKPLKPLNTITNTRSKHTYVAEQTRPVLSELWSRTPVLHSPSNFAESFTVQPINIEDHQHEPEDAAENKMQNPTDAIDTFERASRDTSAASQDTTPLPSQTRSLAVGNASHTTDNFVIYEDPVSPSPTGLNESPTGFENLDDCKSCLSDQENIQPSKSSIAASQMLPDYRQQAEREPKYYIKAEPGSDNVRPNWENFNRVCEEDAEVILGRGAGTWPLQEAMAVQTKDNTVKNTGEAAALPLKQTNVMDQEEDECLGIETKHDTKHYQQEPVHEEPDSHHEFNPPCSMIIKRETTESPDYGPPPSQEYLHSPRSPPIKQETTNSPNYGPPTSAESRNSTIVSAKDDAGLSLSSDDGAIQQARSDPKLLAASALIELSRTKRKRADETEAVGFDDRHIKRRRFSDTDEAEACFLHSQPENGQRDCPINRAPLEVASSYEFLKHKHSPKYQHQQSHYQNTKVRGLNGGVAQLLSDEQVAEMFQQIGPSRPVPSDERDEAVHDQHASHKDGASTLDSASQPQRAVESTTERVPETRCGYSAEFFDFLDQGIMVSGVLANGQREEWTTASPTHRGTFRAWAQNKFINTCKTIVRSGRKWGGRPMFQFGQLVFEYRAERDGLSDGPKIDARKMRDAGSPLPREGRKALSMIFHGRTAPIPDGADWMLSDYNKCRDQGFHTCGNHA